MAKVIDIRRVKSDRRMEAARVAMYENAAKATGAFLEQLHETGAPPSLIFIAALKAVSLYAGRHQVELLQDQIMKCFLEAVVATSERGPDDAS